MIGPYVGSGCSGHQGQLQGLVLASINAAIYLHRGQTVVY